MDAGALASLLVPPADGEAEEASAGGVVEEVGAAAAPLAEGSAAFVLVESSAAIAANAVSANREVMMIRVFFMRMLQRMRLKNRETAQATRSYVNEMLHRPKADFKLLFGNRTCDM